MNAVKPPDALNKALTIDLFESAGEFFENQMRRKSEM